MPSRTISRAAPLLVLALALGFLAACKEPEPRSEAPRQDKNDTPAKSKPKDHPAH